MKKLLSTFTAIVLTLTLGLFMPDAGVTAGASDYEPEGFEFSSRVLLVGDSTVCFYPEDRCLPFDRYGWGMKLGEMFKGVTVINYAVGGASTINYFPLPQYTQLSNDLGKGDYLFIQFGHNDEAVTTSRGTYTGLDAATLDEYGKDAQGRYSYEFLLMKYYVGLARSKGAVPVLVTPVTRLANDGQALYKEHTAYQNAMKTLGRQYNIPVIDMTSKTVALYTELYDKGGADATRELHCFIDAERTTIDQSHLSGKGAAMIASMIADETKALGLTLGGYLPCTRTAGDANGDKQVSIMDVLIIRQHMAGWNVDIDLSNADVNGDNKVDILDVLLIRQSLAGWNVTLT